MMDNSLLLERKLTSEFTFGFELEAYADDYVNVENPDLDGSGVIEFIDERIGPDGDFHRDGSLSAEEGCVLIVDPDDDIYMYEDEEVTRGELEELFGDLDKVPFQSSFEYASPVLRFNPENIQKVIKMLYDGMQGHYFYTNENCGFHHHLSFDNITGEDAAWIVSNLAMDDNGRKLLSTFVTKNYQDEDIQYNFITAWSDDGYLDSLKQAIEDFDFSAIVALLNTEKYSILNVHSNNTLEWRGPRDFLSSQMRNQIVDFYKQLWKFVNWMINVLDKKEINGMNKNLYIKNISSAGGARPIENFPRFKVNRNELLDNDTLMDLIDKISNDPKILLNITSNKRILDQIIQKLFNSSKLGRVINSLYNSLDIVPGTIADISYKYIPAVMYKRASSDAVYNTSERTLKRLVSTRYGIDDVPLCDRIAYLVPQMKTELLTSIDSDLIVDIIDKSQYKLLDFLFGYLNDEQASLMIRNALDNYSQNIDIEKIYNNLPNNSLKSEIKEYFKKKIIDNPSYIKYIEASDIDNYTLISIIGYAMRRGDFDKVKEFLISTGKVSKKKIEEMENYFTKYYEHDLNDEIEQF